MLLPIQDTINKKYQRCKLIISSKTIFYEIICNINPILDNNNFPNQIMNEEKHLKATNYRNIQKKCY